MVKKNNYEILGLNKADNPTLDQIKAAYKKLAKANHPDLNPNDPGAVDRIKEINRAYDELQKGITGDEPDPVGPGAGPDVHDFEDIIRDFFRSSGRGGFHSFSNPTINLSVNVPVGLVISGGDITVGYDRPIRLENGYRATKRVSKRITIPKDAAVGEPLVFKGEGGHDDPTNPPGDLRINLNLMNDGTYQVDGNGVHVIEPVSALDAAMGTEREIDTLEGKRVKLKIKPGTQPGTIYALKDRGLRITGTKRMPLHVHVNVVVPTITDEDHMEALRKIIAGEKFRIYDPSDVDYIDLDGP